MMLIILYLYNFMSYITLKINILIIFEGFYSYFFLSFTYFVGECEYTTAQVQRSEDTTCESPVAPSTMWVSGIEFMSDILRAIPFSH